MAGVLESWSPSDIFSLSSLSASPPPHPLLLLYPPLLKESSSALQLTELFLVLCATCCLKTQLQLLVHQRSNTQRASKCIFVSVYACSVYVQVRLCVFILSDMSDGGGSAQIWVECAGC